MDKLIPLIAGGAAGTLSRYFLSLALQQSFGNAFPYATLAVNLIGCFLMGFFTGAGNGSFCSTSQLLLVTGFCGAFTTFSTFIFEVSILLKNESTLNAFLYIFLSVLAGFIALKFGFLLARTV